MKLSRSLCGLIAGAVVFAVIAALAQPLSNLTKGIRILNGDNTPFFTGINTSSNQTANLMELWNSPGGPAVFSVSSTGVIPSASAGIQSGTNLMTGTSVTNSFATAYSLAPRVVACCSDGTIVCGVTNVTTTNFIVKVSATNGVVNWIAVQQ